MRRVTTIILTLVLVVTLCGCKKTQEPTGPNTHGLVAGQQGVRDITPAAKPYNPYEYDPNDADSLNNLGDLLVAEIDMEHICVDERISYSITDSLLGMVTDIEYSQTGTVDYPNGTYNRTIIKNNPILSVQEDYEITEFADLELTSRVLITTTMTCEGEAYGPIETDKRLTDGLYQWIKGFGASHLEITDDGFVVTGSMYPGNIKGATCDFQETWPADSTATFVAIFSKDEIPTLKQLDFDITYPEVPGEMTVKSWHVTITPGPGYKTANPMFNN